MNELMIAGAALNSDRMTSLQIAEITGKRHADVMRDIRGLLGKGLAECNFALGTYMDANKQSRPMFNLTKKGCLILASGYDALLREKIINRWEELELSHQQRIPQTYSEALRLAAEQAEQLEQQSLLLTAQKPKVLFADAVETSESSVLIGELAKVITANGYKIGQNRLFNWLRDNGYLCKRKGEAFNQPNQRYVEEGLFKIKKRTVQNGDGSIRVTSTTKVTGKGQIYFVNKFLTNK